MSKLDAGLSAVRTVMSVRLVPVLLIVFAITWPLAGFPWWPIALVLGLAVVLRLVGYAWVLEGRRGPVLLVALLAVTTLGAWSPWAAVTCVGVWIAGVGVWRLPNWHLLALGLVLVVVAGTGWIVDVLVTASEAESRWAQESAYTRAQLLPGSPRETLGALMASASEGDTRVACFLLDDIAEAQMSAAAGTADCAGAVLAWSARVTRPDDYTTSVQLQGVVVDVSPDRESATVTACDLEWTSPITGQLPDAGPSSPGRLELRRELGAGYLITGYAPC